MCVSVRLCGREGGREREKKVEAEEDEEEEEAEAICILLVVYFQFYKEFYFILFLFSNEILLDFFRQNAIKCYIKLLKTLNKNL